MISCSAKGICSSFPFRLDFQCLSSRTLTVSPPDWTDSFQQSDLYKVHHFPCSFYQRNSDVDPNITVLDLYFGLFSGLSSRRQYGARTNFIWKIICVNLVVLGLSRSFKHSKLHVMQLFGLFLVCSLLLMSNIRANIQLLGPSSQTNWKFWQY